jgi:carbonic anhydrase
MDPERRVTNANRELFAQGAGNAISGLIGGLPITSVIVRSTANVNAGARTKLSTIFHAALLLICTIAIASVLNKIPLGALAAILILTGWKLAKPAVFMQMFKNGKYQFIPFIVTVVVILAIDLFKISPVLSGKGLIIGVVAGIIVATGAILHGNLKNSYFFNEEKHHEGDKVVIHLSEEVSFLNKASIRQTLDHMPANTKVLIDASSTKYIDFDVLGLIKEFRDIKAPLKNIELELKGFKEEYKIFNTDNVQSITTSK